MEKTITFIKVTEGCTWQCEYKKYHRYVNRNGNDLPSLVEYGGYLSFSKKWGRNILDEVVRT